MYRKQDLNFFYKQFILARKITQQKNIYLYAGAVRDLLLNRLKYISDYDFIGDFDLDSIEKEHKKYIIGRWNDISTLRINIYNDIYDFTSSKNIKNTLSSHDITISCILINMNGKFFDYFEGLKDLEERKIRIIDPEIKILKDPSRITRVLRFSKKLNFKIDSNTNYYCNKYKYLLE